MKSGQTLPPPGTPCPFRDLLPAYVNGTLARFGADGPTPEAMAAHIHACAACRAEHAAWVAIAGAVRAATDVPSVGGFDRVLAGIVAPPRAAEHRGETQVEPVAARLGAAQHPLPLPTVRNWAPWFVGTSLVAALVLLLVAFDRRPSPTDERPRLPALALASPESTSMPNPYIRIVDGAVDIAECSTEPRYPGAVEGMRAASGATPDPLSFGGDNQLSDYPEFGRELSGPAPAPETLAGINETLRQMVACRYYGMAVFGEERYDLDSRHLALFSDRYVTELAVEMEGRGFRLPLWPTNSDALSISDAVQTGDGNVIVRLERVSGKGFGAVTILLAPERGGWVIDDWGQFGFPGDPAPTEADAVPQSVQVIATDTLAVGWAGPKSDADVLPVAIITVANTGEGTCRFAIPELGFAIDIAAGHSVDLRVDAPPGTYALDLTVSGSADRLDADLVIDAGNGSATATPISERHR